MLDDMRSVEMRAFHRIMNIKYITLLAISETVNQTLIPLAFLIDETLTKTQPGTSPARRDWIADV